MELDANLNNQEKKLVEVLDKVVETGKPREIIRKGRRIVISPVESSGKFELLEDHPDFIIGDPEDLVHVDWSSEWKPNL